LREVFLKNLFNPSQLPEYQANKKPGYLATAGLLGEICSVNQPPFGRF